MDSHDNCEHCTQLARRAFLGRGIAGVGLLGAQFAARSAALRADLARRGQSAASRPQSQARHFSLPGGRAFAPRDLRLQTEARRDARQAHAGIADQGPADRATAGRPLVCFGPQHGFKKYGKSGQEMCDLFPHIGSIADDLCIVRSMWTEQINHDPAHTIMNTGSIIPGRPSMGSWILYGLGAETRGSARLRGPALRRPRRPDAADRDAPVVRRAAAEQVSGRQTELGGRSGALHSEPAGHERQGRSAPRSTR